MLHEERAPGWHYPVVAALLAAFFFECWSASSIKTPAWDEPGHIAAGLSYIQTGEFRINPQHPPLLKELSGLSLYLSGSRWPTTPDAQALFNGETPLQWKVGSGILIAGGVDRTLFYSRLPAMLLATLLGAVLYLWGRRLFGSVAAMGALTLYVLDPNVAAHSYLVTTDAGFAAFAVLFLFALWHYSAHPSRRGLILCGVAMGAMLAAKYSAVLLLPVGGLLLLAAASVKPFSGLQAAPDDACPCGSARKFKNCHGAVDKRARSGTDWSPYISAVRDYAIMGAIAAAVVETLYFFGHPGLYFYGLGLVNADHAAGYLHYMAGQLDTRFLSYFVVAYLLKEPLAAIALVSVGAVVLIRGKQYGRVTKLFVLLPPAIVVAGYSAMAAGMGIRYIIPALPFLHLLGGLGLATLLAAGWKWRTVAAVLMLWCAMAAVGIHPDQLSYFNEVACLATEPGQVGLDGGSRCGYRWMDDSNVDWGMSLKQLKQWADRNGKGRPLHLAYFGSFPPQAYGLDFEPVTEEGLGKPPQPGLYAVSTHFVGGLSAMIDHMGQGPSWMRTTRPIALVGHGLFIYDIPGAGAAPAK